MHSDIAVLKLKSNERELAKKKAGFWTTFFYRSEAGSSAVEAVGPGQSRVAYLYLNIYSYTN